MSRKIRVGSRRSRLAVAQAEDVVQYIRRYHPEMKVELVTLETTGDRRLDVTLDQIGGKGLFVRELDQALLEGTIDLAVHSLKDLPMEESEELPIVAFSGREDARDVLVLPKGVTGWNGRGVIGCSSFRRRIQAEQIFPEAVFQSIRGNVLTRLEKLDRGEYDALILAAAGLHRLGLKERISRYFTVEEILPAAGQGILAVQGRKGSDYGFLDGYGDPASASAARAERAFVRYLDGGCTSPVAAYAEVKDGKMILRGLYELEQAGSRQVSCLRQSESNRTGMMEGTPESAEALGIHLAKELQSLI